MKKRLKIVKLLIKFLCGNNATCKSYPVTSHLSFSRVIAVAECQRKVLEQTWAVLGPATEVTVGLGVCGGTEKPTFPEWSP